MSMQMRHTGQEIRLSRYNSKMRLLIDPNHIWEP